MQQMMNFEINLITCRQGVIVLKNRRENSVIGQLFL